jgi:hypothetical protein
MQEESIIKSNMGAEGGIDQGDGTVNVFNRVYLFCICYLRITLICI